MSETTNLKMQLPAGTDWADVETLNQNFQKVDAEMPGANVKETPADTDKVLLYDSEDKALVGKPKKVLLSKLIELWKNTFCTKDELSSSLLKKASASDLTAHTGNESNPHGVTAEQVGAIPKAITNVTSADDLLAKLKTVVGANFFTDWADATPNQFGSGVIIQGLDTRNNVVLYRGGDNFYTGRLADGAIVWKGPYIYGTSGTAALTAGTSTLANGAYYNQYE